MSLSGKVKETRGSAADVRPAQAEAPKSSPAGEVGESARPDLSAIVVDYHSLKTLGACVESIRRNTGSLDIEIIISSNSTYTSEEQISLETVAPGAKIICNEKNLGFARAVNVGIRESRGCWLLLVNPDCELLSQDLARAVQHLEQNPRIGILGPAIVNSLGELQESHRTFPTPIGLLWRVLRGSVVRRRFAVTASSEAATPRLVDWVSGACMLVRKSAVERVGLMDERFFMYVEDVDWCKRFWGSGFEVLYWPGMVARHDAQRISSVSLATGCSHRLLWIHCASWVKYFLKDMLDWNRRRIRRT